MSKLQEVRTRLETYREKRLLKSEQKPLHHVQPLNNVETAASDESLKENCDTDSETKPRNSWWMTGLKIILWLLMWGFFIEVEFGLVYLVVSGLVFIVVSLQGSRRAPGKLSAYSVFNKNLEAIEGTLSAEQFERELRYGPSTVR